MKDDYISRQAAKKALEDRFMELQKRHDDKKYETNYCLNTILELPSVNLKEPKTGHWIDVIDDIDSFGNKTWHYECSICGNPDSGWIQYKYCPNCGARMEDK